MVEASVQPEPSAQLIERAFGAKLVIALPKPISSWTELLSSFPDDIQSMVLSLVNQLSPLIDSIKTLEDQGLVESDGLEGVGRSAHYERLLLSEWALQDHFPDEFIRRAVAGEHLFHEVKRIESKENKTCFVLFDCGPEQLGRPRIVQLAVLILLARRAEKNGSTFKWGIIQDEKKQLHESVSKPLVLHWLQQRSVCLATQPLTDEWIALYMQSIGVDIDEQHVDVSDFLQDFWFVSPSSLRFSAKVVRQVNIIEPILNPDFIDVELNGPTKRTISLQLAREDINVKIIRNPFNDKTKTSQSNEWNVNGSWLMSSNGRRFACQEKERVIGIHTINLSKSKKKPEKTTLKVPGDQELLGMYLNKKQSVVLSYDRQYFYFHHFPRHGQIKKIAKTQTIRKRDKDDSFLSTVIYQTENGENKFLILDSQKNLRELPLDDTKPLFSTTSNSVIALGSLVNCDYYIEYDQDRSEIVMNWYLGAYNPCRKVFKTQHQNANPGVFVHGSGPWFKGSIGCFAYEITTNTWALVSGKKTEQVNVDDSDRVIGVLALSEAFKAETKHGDRKKIVLIVVRDDSRSMFAVFGDGEKMLLELGSEFKRGNINPRHPFVHYINSNDELVVVDLLEGEELLTLTGKGGSYASL